jgi:hypothetical protein
MRDRRGDLGCFRFHGERLHSLRSGDCGSKPTEVYKLNTGSTSFWLTETSTANPSLTLLEHADFLAGLYSA